MQLKQTVVKVVRLPAFLWAVCLALLAVTRIITMPERYAHLLQQVLGALLLGSIVIVVDRVLEILARQWLERNGSPMARSGLIGAVIATTVYGLGGLMILAHFGVQIGPLLTAMGVGGLAAALAFKDTLENMFSGIHLLIDQSVEVGDLIEIESGQEGVVQDIGWRTSKIRLHDESTLIIPNTKLAQNITIRKKKKAVPKSLQQTSLYRQVK
jgi:small-conductance mechanosensitive channel